MSVLRQDQGPLGTRILQIEVGRGENLNEIIADAQGRAAIVDPAYEVDRLLREAAAHGMKIEAVLITHTHPDHIDGLWETVERTGARRVYVGRAEVGRARKAAERGVPEAVQLVPLDGGETFEVGAVRFATLATPGHTPAGMSYLFDGCVCTGDTLFVGGCGRADFPGSDPKTLWKSLQKLAGLPEETRVYPGHDYGATPTSSIGHEVATNPYLRCADEAAFVALRMGKNPHRPTRGSR
jgi:glyoxylase-like metal-dependent hydrolase (beta-lactamase superfamily II)